MLQCHIRRQTSSSCCTEEIVMNINTKYLNTRDLGLSKHGNITKKDEWAGPFAVNASLPRFFSLNVMKYFLSIYIKYSRIGI